MPSTPRFAERFRETIAEKTAEVEKSLADPQRSLDLEKCTVLGPVLELIYLGRTDDAARLFRRLYSDPDADAILAETMRMVREGPYWVSP